MPVPVVRPREVVIAEEQDYLFYANSSAMQAPDWADAACRGAEPDVFFPISPRDHASRDEALAFCASCRIQTQCRVIALRDPSLVGIWGGTDELDRARLRGRRAPVLA